MVAENVDGQNRHRHTSDLEESSDGDSSFCRNHSQGRIRNRDFEDDRRWESGMKTEIPEFKGGMIAEEFVDWLSNVEEIFDFKEVLEHRRVKLVATRLRGRAMA